MEKNSYLGLAAIDLETAEVLYNCGSSSLYNSIGMSCVQSIERNMKAVLETIQEVDDRCFRSHNLKYLARVIWEQTGITLEERQNLALVDGYYFNTRYSGDDFYLLTKSDAEEALEIVKRVATNTKKYFDECRVQPSNLFS